MRIAMILESPLFFGGGEIHAYEISRHLVKLGHEVDFIQMHGAPRKRSLPRNGLLYPSRWIAAPTSQYLNAIYARILWLYGYLAIPIMYREMIRGKYDILHVHGFGSSSTLLAAVLAKSNSSRIVCTLHNDLARHIDRKIIKRLIPRVDAFIAVSRSIRSKWLEAYGSECFLIPNGVDSSRFNPNVDGSKVRKRLGLEKKFVVLSVSRLSYQKGLEYLILAISQLKEQPDLTVLICGTGEQESYLKKLTRDLQLEKSVRFLGYVPSSQLPELYAACDVFVLPSIFEVFGLTLLEATSTGKPIISTNVGIAKEAKRELEVTCGARIVQSRKPDQIAEAILWHFEHRNVRDATNESMVRHEYVSKNFSWERIAEKIETVYKSFE